jgi:hypothetical protein
MGFYTMAISLIRILARTEKSEVDPELISKFNALANKQRGIPESMFHREVNPGADHSNIWQWAMEHTGDLIHRAAQTEMDFWGKEALEEKVRKLYRAASQAYGFEREVEEGIDNNWKYRVENNRYKGTVEQYRKEAYEAGVRYGKAYMKLEPITKFQRLGKEAAIRLGYRKWVMYRSTLDEFERLIKAGKLETDYYTPE